MARRAIEPAHAGERVAAARARGPDHGVGRAALEEQDRPPLGAHRLEEQVEHELEQLVQGAVHDELAGRLAEDGEDPVLALQLREVDGGVRVDRGELLDREDARALRLPFLFVLFRRLRAEGEGVLAEGDHVARPQPPPLAHGLPVEERAVLALEVAHPVALAPLLDRGVVAGEPLVGQEDVALAGAPDRDPPLRERVALAGAAGGLDGDLGHDQGYGGFYILRRAGPAGESRRAGPNEARREGVSPPSGGASGRSSPCGPGPRRRDGSPSARSRASCRRPRGSACRRAGSGS